jgi:Putative transposase
MKRDQWVENQVRDLLPTTYYHIVFTVPSELRGLIMGQRTSLFNLLFEASSQTLLTIAKDPTYLGATPGITSVLHTWGQSLVFHPHIHCIVSGGGIDGNTRWIKEKRTNGKFLFPKAILQKMYKAIVMKKMRQLYQKDELKIPPDMNWDQLLSDIGAKKWNVYAKAPFIHNANGLSRNSLSRFARDGGPEQVIRYLGKYTHKIAITRHRIKSLTETTITFQYRDYQDGNKAKEMTLSHEEFLRRFEQHLLPKRFIKIRHYGYLQNYKKKERLDRIYKNMQLPRRPDRVKIPMHIRLLEKTGRDITLCPKCKVAKLELVHSQRNAAPKLAPKLDLKQYQIKTNEAHAPP